VFIKRAVVEVPGWPDAPKWVRFRRAFPIIFPATIALLLIAGSKLIHQPHMDSVRAEHSGLLTTEQELQEMRFRWSDQRAEELAEHARVVSGRLLPSPKAVEGFLAGFEAEFRSLGWDFRFQAYDVPVGATERQSTVAFAPALVRMSALAGNESPLESFLKVTARLGGSGPRVDVTRLLVTVYEDREPQVEMNLRIACAVNDEKAAE
jgi:hypothetical protein